MSEPTFASAPGLQWTVESTGLLLVRPDRGVCGVLKYPDAAVWDFVTRGYGLPQIARMTRYIGGFPDEAAARQFVQERLEAWQKSGWLECTPAGTTDV
jgi:hypothetical protein